MRRIVRFLGVAIGALLLLNGCSQSSPDTGRRDNVSDKEIQIQDTTYAEEQDTLLQIPEKLTDMRRPDMKVRVRKGSALCLETEGFQLVAVDTAVKHTREYFVTSLQEEDIAPLPQGMKNMTAATAGYRLLPSGVHFSPYAELHVAYDPERLPFGYTPEDIYTSYYDTATMAWVRLERLFIDTVNHEIVSATTHFTDFINELLKAPEMPETQAFVPTQMSDLEAVNPLDGMPLIQPPAAAAELFCWSPIVSLDGRFASPEKDDATSRTTASPESFWSLSAPMPNSSRARSTPFLPPPSWNSSNPSALG